MALLFRFLALLVVPILFLSPAPVAAAGPALIDVECGTTSTQVVAAAPGRVFLILQNLSDTDIWINLIGGAAIVGKYLVMAPRQSLTLDIRDTGVLSPAMTTTAITCIHNGSGTKTLGGLQID